MPLSREERNARQRARWPLVKEKHRQARLRREALNPNARAYEKTARKLKKYGLTAEQYTQMFINQQNLCGICKQPEQLKQFTGTIKPLSVDHCHKTGQVRMLLCNSCNVGLANFKENINTMWNAIQYIKKFSEVLA